MHTGQAFLYSAYIHTLGRRPSLVGLAAVKGDFAGIPVVQIDQDRGVLELPFVGPGACNTLELPIRRAELAFCFWEEVRRHRPGVKNKIGMEGPEEDGEYVCVPVQRHVCRARMKARHHCTIYI